MMTSNIRIEGLDRAIRKVERVGNMDIVKAGLKEAGIHVKGKIKQYPPQTQANVPKGPGGRWYVRGQGSFYARVSGGITERATSEDLGQKWTVKEKKGGLQIVVGNNVSYGPYVQGPDEQASWMKAIGWKTTDQIAEQERDNVNKIVAKAIDRALAKG